MALEQRDREGEYRTDAAGQSDKQGWRSKEIERKSTDTEEIERKSTDAEGQSDKQGWRR